MYSVPELHSAPQEGNSSADIRRVDTEIDGIRIIKPLSYNL